MKKLICLLFLLAGCVHSSSKDGNRSVAGKNVPFKGRHLVMIVHGLGGDKSSFGSLESLLEYYINEVTPGYDPIIRFLDYHNNEEKLTTTVYAQNLEDAIAREFIRHPIKPDDKITIIGHSQGGLVATIWLAKNKIFNSEETYLKRVDSFIAIGSPFWGSKIATLIEYTDSMTVWENKALQLKLYVFDKAAPKAVSMQELSDMALMSDIITNFRSVAIDFDRAGAGKNLKARFLTIAGVAPPPNAKEFSEAALGSELKAKALENLSNYLSKLGFGGKRYESDQAALVPSARMDFIYATDQDAKGVAKDYNDFELLGFDKFRVTDYANMGIRVPFILTETLHTSPDRKNFFAMANPPIECKNPFKCFHPTFKHIIKHILACDQPVNDCDPVRKHELVDALFTYNVDAKSHETLMSQMQGFTLDFRLRLPLDYRLPEEYSRWDGFSKAILLDRVRPYDSDVSKYISDALDDKLHVGDGLLAARKDQDYRFYVSQERELVSGFTKAKYDVNNEINEVRYFLTGVVFPPKNLNEMATKAWLAKHKDGFMLPLKVSLPGLKARTVVARVLPTYSTYVDLTLRHKWSWEHPGSKRIEEQEKK